MKIKKNLGYVVYVFIITILFFGCMNLKTHSNDNGYNAKSELVIKQKFKNGGQNFAFLVKEMTPMLDVDCDRMPILCESFLGSSASGLVLSSDRTSITVLTAAHFCIAAPEEAIFKQKIVGFVNDEPRDMMVLKLDLKNDLCLLLGPKISIDNFKNIKIADTITVGEEVYAVAAPLGIAGPGIRLIFEGRLSGCDVESCITTIPATFGSSGAGILNKRGELISIIMAVPEGFPHVTISPSNSELINFIRNVDAEIDIYSY